MQPLIEIKTVPIEIEMKVQNATMKYTRATANLEVSTDKGGLSIKSQPIRLNIDTFEMQNSIMPTAMRSIEQAAQKGKQAVYEATGTYSQRGQLLMKAKIGQQLVSQFAAETADKMAGQNKTFGLGFSPSVPPDISWEAGEINIRYEMDKLNFDWRMNKMNFEFTPGDIQFTVTQQPDVIISYVGGPIYVPKSADPNYEPVDVQA